MINLITYKLNQDKTQYRHSQERPDISFIEYSDVYDQYDFIRDTGYQYTYIITMYNLGSYDMNNEYYNIMANINDDPDFINMRLSIIHYGTMIFLSNEDYVIFKMKYNDIDVVHI